MAEAEPEPDDETARLMGLAQRRMGDAVAGMEEEAAEMEVDQTAEVAAVAAVGSQVGVQQAEDLTAAAAAEKAEEDEDMDVVAQLDEDLG